MSNKVIYAIYNDDDVLMDAVKKTRAAHHHIEEASFEWNNFVEEFIHNLGNKLDQGL